MTETEPGLYQMKDLVYRNYFLHEKEAPEDVYKRQALNVNESRVERWCQKVREPMLEKIRKLQIGRAHV